MFDNYMMTMWEVLVDFRRIGFKHLDEKAKGGKYETIKLGS
ncbi:hypothetical protein Psfp_02984 [Pelotomaculum sp. FP]|nr:hypothetical protein Psfp_02984 [Pelotomaculum sp. FP]